MRNSEEKEPLWSCYIRTLEKRLLLVGYPPPNRFLRAWWVLGVAEAVKGVSFFLGEVALCEGCREDHLTLVSMRVSDSLGRGLMNQWEGAKGCLRAKALQERFMNKKSQSHNCHDWAPQGPRKRDDTDTQTPALPPTMRSCEYLSSVHTQTLAT